MIRDVNLLGYLPPFMQEYVEMQQLFLAEQPDVQKLEDETEIVKNNQFIQSCNLVGIKKFEDLMKIIPLADDTLDARISRVLTRWNDVVPYTKQTLKAKLDTLCGENNYTMTPNFNEYTLDIITHLELSGQVDELDYFLSYMIPANIVLTSRNEMNLMMNAKTIIGSGIVQCETFELSDNFKKEISIMGSALNAGGVVDTVQIEISDQFNETIQISGQPKVATNVSVTEMN